MIEQLENDLQEELESSAAAQTRGSRSVQVEGKQIDVFARRTRHGETMFGYSYCGVRLERVALLTLLCPEEACPRSTQLRKQWKALQGEVVPIKTVPLVKPQARPLFEEVAVRVGARSCVARPATFRTVTPCPFGAHPALPMQKSGWDLFENGKWVAGGLVPSSQPQALVPMLPNIGAAEAWIANNSDSVGEDQGVAHE